jgi:hypothetical protein
MSNEKPLTSWQQCKAISEALAPTPEDPRETVRRLRAALMAQLAAMGEKGAALAARFADTDGPIQIEDGDVPPELLEMLRPANPPRDRRA